MSSTELSEVKSSGDCAIPKSREELLITDSPELAPVHVDDGTFKYL